VTRDSFFGDRGEAASRTCCAFTSPTHCLAPENNSRKHAITSSSSSIYDRFFYKLDSIIFIFTHNEWYPILDYTALYCNCLAQWFIIKLVYTARFYRYFIC